MNATQREAIELYYKELAGKPFRPSSGTEGDVFQSLYCNRCAKDWISAPGSVANYCGLVADSMRFEVDDPQYPAAWVHNADGSPCCMEFVPMREENQDETD